MVRNACMTCYEALQAQEAAPVAAPMAHHIMKWWRNKFRNGYKKFHAGTDSERTDTEELVGRAPSQCSAPPDLLPSEARALLQPSSPTSNSGARRTSPPPSPPEQRDKSRIRFEELTCDVQVEHETPQQQPLQFSFTLYDLDGHGIMTKDDIAGIVSTIYESVGKSVTVPHYGSKTIQVRLTVVPETRSGQSQRPRRRNRKHHDDDDKEGKGRDTGRGNSDDDNNAIPMPRHKKRSGSLQRKQLLQIIQANMEKNNLSFQTNRKAHQEYKMTSNDDEQQNNGKPHRHRSRAYTLTEKPSIDTHQKNRTDHQHNYLDLAHDRNIYDRPNHERNHHNERSPHMEMRHERAQNDQRHERSIYESRHERETRHTGETRHERSTDLRHERPSYIYERPDEVMNDPNLCRYDRYLHAVICSSAKHANTGFHQKIIPKSHKSHKPHHRSRSHDMPNRPGIEPRVLQIIFL